MFTYPKKISYPPSVAFWEEIGDFLESDFISNTLMMPLWKRKTWNVKSFRYGSGDVGWVGERGPIIVYETVVVHVGIDDKP